MAEANLSDRQFGLIIAFIIPGFIVLHALAESQPLVAMWIAKNDRPTIGGFFYSTLASIGGGLLVSTLRWLTIDPALYWSGVSRPHWSLSMLPDRVESFDKMVLYTYRYYQFYANSFVAIAIWIACDFLQGSQWRSSQVLLAILVESVLIFGARDTLAKYHERTNELLQQAKTSIIIRPWE